MMVLRFTGCVEDAGEVRNGVKGCSWERMILCLEDYQCKEVLV